MGKSTAPSGLSISRNGEKFTFKWKQPTKKYGDGQDFQYSVNNKKWTDVSVGKTTTSKAFNIPRSRFFPTSGKPTSAAIKFRVRGNTDGSKTMSSWTTKAFNLALPNKPTVTTEIMTWPQVKFTWNVATKTDDSKWFTRVEYTSVLVKNSNETNGAKIDWSTTVTGSTRYNTTSASASSYLTVTDDSGMLGDGNSYTRWFRVRAQGARGNSDWTYAKHVYAMSNQCTVTKTEITQNASDGYTAKVWFSSPFAASRPLSEAKVEYTLTTPDSDMSVPGAATWTEGATVKVKDSTSGAIFSIDSLVDTDQALFVRVNSVYDGRTTYGTPVAVDFGKLAAPTGLSVATDSGTHKATVTATNASSVPDSYLVVKYITNDDPNGIDIGIIPHGETTAIVQCPEWTEAPTFGVYAAAPGGTYILNAYYELTTDVTVVTGKQYYDLDDGEYVPVEPDPGDNPSTEGWYETTGVTRYDVDAKMVSDVVKDGGSVPDAPQSVTAYPVSPEGTIRVTWVWSWDDADSCELSWADHADAWESTDEPQTYIISRLRASAWNISNLQTGMKWYVRVRLIDTSGDSQTFGAYSETQVVDLSSAPLVPSINLSDAIIPPDGTVTVSWVYSTTDGTHQAFAEIAEMIEDPDNPGTYIPSAPIAQVQTAQYATLDAAELGWTSGETHEIIVRVASASGRESDGWSDSRPVIIADPPSCTITSTSLGTVTISTTDDEGNPTTETFTALTAMPFTCTVTGAGDSGITSVAIERAEAFHVDRPDETSYNGFEGETVAVDSHYGEDGFTISVEDLIGHLDDGANYRLVATVTDRLGQSAEDSIDFMVLWSHQASAPTATVSIDPTDMIAVMTPTAPADADPTDVCDIYRLSIDRPQLIYEGAAFGTAYVDPFPTIGRYGGHRFVTRTANGDVTTADDSFAWADVNEPLNTRYNVFDFDDGRVLLELDVEISNQWHKDFKETQYLGGSVQGDWNKAVSRSASVSGTAIPGRDDVLIQAMRRLADRAGICHVRTKDGSSYAADVQVSDKYNYASGITTYEYSMTITRVEPEELDGMTLTEWENVNEESES